MPRDYVHLTKTKKKLHRPKNGSKKRSSRSKQQEKKRFPWKISLAVFFLLLLFAYGVAELKTYFPVIRIKLANLSHHEHTPSLVKNAEKIQSQNKTTTPHSNIKFDFYTMLPSLSVEGTPATLKSPKTLSPFRSEKNYIVHVFSSPDLKKANQLKQKLVARHLNAKIYPVQQGQIILYRVQIGPYDKQEKAILIHNQLQKLNISSIVVELME